MGPVAKRRKLAQPRREEEILFDPNARQQFLTGFHKRKLQRTKHAQEATERRAKEDRRAERKRIREERQAQLDQTMREHQQRMKELNPESEAGTDDDEEEEEWNGFEEPEQIDREAEYIDEEKYTTVKVQAVDPNKESLEEAFGASDSESEAEHAKEQKADTTESKLKQKKSKKPPRDPNKKKLKKKRNFRYESKEERKLARAKERLGNRKQAQQRKRK